jgi:mono/diheme cytochrome c family protein
VSPNPVTDFGDPAGCALNGAAVSNPSETIDPARLFGFGILCQCSCPAGRDAVIGFCGFSGPGAGADRNEGNRMKNLGLAIGGVMVAGLGVLAWQEMRPPPAPQGQPMSSPGSNQTAKGAALVEVQLPAQLSADAQIGRRGYDAKCASCHGANAAGQDGVAPPLVHKIYEPGHHGDMSFVLAAQNGVRSHHWTFGDMPPVDGLTAADVGYIVRYVRELQQANGID